MLLEGARRERERTRKLNLVSVCQEHAENVWGARREVWIFKLYSRSDLVTLQKSAPLQPKSWALSTIKSGLIMSFSKFLMSNILMLPRVQAVSKIFESLENARVNKDSSCAPLMAHFIILSWAKMLQTPASSAAAIYSPLGENAQFLTASPPGWKRQSVFSPVLTSHKMTLPSTLELAMTWPWWRKHEHEIELMGS